MKRYINFQGQPLIMCISLLLVCYWNHCFINDQEWMILSHPGSWCAVSSSLEAPREQTETDNRLNVAYTLKVVI